MRSGGQIVVDCLAANGVDRVFGVPGESFLAILDALVDQPDIQLIIARQEGGAAMMAEADAKLTGRPGVCLVTRGPGAANAYAGVHVAAQDSTPLILLMGQVATGDMEREAFQEIDIKGMFGSQVKWAAQVNDVERLPEFLARAFSTAMSGRPGPVVLALPENVLSATCDCPAPKAAVVSSAAPAGNAMDELRERLAASRSPLMIVGGEHWSSGDRSTLISIAEAWDIPVACAFRCQDRFPNSHPNYAGDVGLGINPALAKRIKSADLVVALGARLGDCTTSGYTLFDSPYPTQQLVHIHADPEELGRVFQPAQAINSGVGAFIDAFAALGPMSNAVWGEWTRQANRDYRAWTDKATDVIGNFNLGEAIIWLRENLPADAIITNGAGNYAAWLHRFYRHCEYRTQVAPTSGSMGYGMPAAIAAALRHPDRMVVALAGDGCFQMTCQELGTIAQYGVKLTLIIVNNSMYGTIRMHQENHYPQRVSGTDIHNPDFAALAHAYGLHAEKVTATADFAAAFERAQSAATAAVIEVVTDKRVLTPTRSM